MALAGVAVILPADRLATVFVVDLSDSVGNGGRAEASPSSAMRSRSDRTEMSRASSRSAGTRSWNASPTS